MGIIKNLTHHTCIHLIVIKRIPHVQKIELGQVEGQGDSIQVKGRVQLAQDEALAKGWAESTEAKGRVELARAEDRVELT